MATVKIKFCPSVIEGEQGTILYQVIHKRNVRKQKTDYRFYAHEWNPLLANVVLLQTNEERTLYLRGIKERIRVDVKCLHKIISRFEQLRLNYTVDDVISEFLSSSSINNLFPFMEETIAKLKALGKIRTSETYTATLNSFKRFRNNKDLLLNDLDSDMMTAYEVYLRNAA